MGTFLGVILFLAGIVFIAMAALSTYTLLSGGGGFLLASGNVGLLVGAAVFGFILCVTGYQMVKNS